MISRTALAGTLAISATPVAAAPLHFDNRFIEAVASGAYVSAARNESQAAVTAPLARLVPPDYADGVGAPAGPDRPNPRALSLALNEGRGAEPDAQPLSNLAVAFSQIHASHDTALTTTGEEVFDIPVAAEDPVAERVDGMTVMPMRRSHFEGGTGPGDPRRPVNVETPAFDASIVYSSEATTLGKLREGDGTGRMRIGPGFGLPIVDGQPQAGDRRSAENLLLAGLHGLYLREHNRLADGIGAACGAAGADCSGDEIFGAAREIVEGAQQKAVYEEFLPIFLGTSDLASLVPDRALVDRAELQVLTEFSTAAGRLGHSQVPATLTAHLPGEAPRSNQIEDCLFTQTCLPGEDLAAVLYGAVTLAAEPIDVLVTEGLRNGQIPSATATFLIDLEATNIARGRDHGLGDYQAVRAALGFPDAPLEALLPQSVLDLYPEGSGIDLIVGLLAEARPDGAYLGETAAAIWGLQFEWLKSDPTFYQSLDPGDPLAALIGATDFTSLIADNTRLGPFDFAHSPFLAQTGEAIALAPVPLPPAMPAVALAFGVLAFFRRRTLPPPRRTRYPAGEGKGRDIW